MTVYAANRKDAERYSATWREMNARGGWTKHTITFCPEGLTAGNARTLPGYIDADGTTADRDREGTHHHED